MDDKRSVLSRNPERHANFLSRIFFCYITPLMYRGLKRDLQQEDLFEHLPQDESRLLFEQLKSSWEAECARDDKDKRPVSLFRAVLNTFGYSFLWYGLLIFLEEIIKMAQPLFIGGLVRYFRYDHPLTQEEAYFYAGGIAFCAAMYPLIHHPYFYGVQKIGMKAKIATSALIFDKALRLSSGALHETTVGKIVNLLSTDVTKFDFAVLFCHYIFLFPFLLIGYGALLWYALGPSCLAGFACIVCLMPIQGVFSRKMGMQRREIAARADKRIGVMSEILNGIRVIKMYAWEGAFALLVGDLRRKELNSVRRFAFWQSLVLGTFWASGRLVILCAVAAFALSGEIVSAERVFVAAALFNSCRLPLTLFLPIGIQFLWECKVSVGRIQEFLLLEDFTPIQPAVTGSDTKDTMLNGTMDSEMSMSPKKRVPNKLSDPTLAHLVMKDYCAKWNQNSETNILDDINLEVSAGQLVAIVGAVGSGKSTILNSILGETRPQSGSVDYEGSIAYVPQEAWVFGGTIRQNITFGLEYDEKRYHQATRISALTKDISLMPHGDQTMVGDRGVALSGGQKARLNLARALYRDGDIYLLDDPLSAVDAAVGRYLFEKCITAHLKDKAVLLVTHQLQYLSAAHNIILLSGGRVIASGSLPQLQKSHPHEFAQVMAETEESYKQLELSARSRPRISTTTSSQGSPSKRKDRLSSSDRKLSSDEEEADDHFATAESSPTERLLKPANELLKSASLSESAWSLAMGEGERVAATDEAGGEEDRNTGAVTWRVYLQYMQAMAPWYQLIPLLIFVVFVQLVMNSTDWWLNIWSTASEQQAALVDIENSTSLMYNATKVRDGPLYELSQETYMQVFAAMCGVLVVLAVSRVLWFRFAQVNASQRLHNSMFTSVVNSKMQFFDTNPTGRILNRFSKDTNTMDEQLAFVFFDFIQGALLFTSIVLVIGALNPLVFVPTIPIGIVFFGLRHVYLRTSRDIKRLESTTRSPVFSLVSATLNGLTAIRAFGAGDSVMRNFHEYQNIYTAAFSMTLTTARWFAGVIDWLVVCYITAVAFISVFSGREWMKSGAVGLALWYSTECTRFFSRFLEVWTRTEVQMVSIERIGSYIKLEPEEEEEMRQQQHLTSVVDSNTKTDHTKMTMTWPSKGAIKFTDMSLKYADDAPLILKHITCDIPSASKVGIVGRTGAGKSSLLRALYRLSEPTGSIVIDGVNIKTLPLKQLRSAISIIPQDPVLFIGTLRKNLDPFDEFTEDNLWKAVEQVELKSAVKALPESLDTHMQEGGANMSVGQRQLVCLARAVLRKTKILVMDEATANVDHQTDALIQRTLRVQFADCTVLTIAHRLNTIMDSTHIMVLKDGALIEFDSPHALLSRPGSLLMDLVNETGSDNAAVLRQMALNAHRERQNDDVRQDRLPSFTS